MENLPKTIYVVIEDKDDNDLYLTANTDISQLEKTHYSMVGKYEFVKYV